jgi:hypothetical protein
VADEPKVKKKKWIQSAIKHPGAMTEAAKREGVSNSEYEKEHEHDSGKAGQRARLAETLKGMHHGKEHKRPTVKSMMHKMHGTKE